MGMATLLKVVTGFVMFMFWFLQQFSTLFSQQITLTQQTSIAIIKFLLLPYSFVQFAGVYILSKNSNSRVKQAVAFSGAMKAMTGDEKSVLKRDEYGAKGDAQYETDKKVGYYKDWEY